MEIILIKTVQLLLCFALLILLHEGGHFFFAKLFKVRVEEFCLFFDPWKSWKLFTYKGTDYHIGWLPLGGYVKIAGMIDESMDTEAMKKPMQPWEFRAKPAWQRLFIMIGGVLVNFLVSLIIYAMVLFTWGEQFIPIEKMSHGFEFNATAQNYGFRNGDIPISTNNEKFESYNSNTIRSIAEATTVTVMRDGSTTDIHLPGNLSLLEMTKDPRFLYPCLPAVIENVTSGSNAEKAGLKAGDQLITINGQDASTWYKFDLFMHDATTLISHYQEENNSDKVDSLRKMTLVVQHLGANSTDTLQASLDENNTFGFLKKNIAADYPISTRQYSLLASIPAGAAHGCDVLSSYVSDLKYLFTAEGAKSVGSFMTIGDLFPSSFDWQKFWELTAFISIILAVMNILPIPALDGGHVMFLLYEVITRRKPSDKFMEYTQIVGMWLLLALMAFALFNDFTRFF